MALVWAAGPFPWSGRSLLLTLGVLALGFGIALAAFASSLAGTFGGDAASGWLFIGAGILTILAALAPFLRARAPQAVSADIEPPGVEEGPEIRPERSA